MSTARAGLGVSVVNDKIYAIGGVLAGTTSFVEEYDPATDTWTRKADMPANRNFLTTSVVNGKIYAIGGSVETDGPFFSTVEAYDPATDTWTRRTDLPEPRYLHTAGVVKGKIYIIAGSPRNRTASNAVFEYDPETDTWIRKADAPTVRSWMSSNRGFIESWCGSNWASSRPMKAPWKGSGAATTLKVSPGPESSPRKEGSRSWPT